GLLSFGDVLEEIHNTDNRSVLVSNRIDVHGYRDAASIWPFDDDLLLVYRDTGVQSKSHRGIAMRHVGTVGMVKLVCAAKTFFSITNDGHTTPEFRSPRIEPGDYTIGRSDSVCG